MPDYRDLNTPVPSWVGDQWSLFPWLDPKEAFAKAYERNQPMAENSLQVRKKELDTLRLRGKISQPEYEKGLVELREEAKILERERARTEKYEQREEDLYNRTIKGTPTWEQQVEVAQRQQQQQQDYTRSNILLGNELEGKRQERQFTHEKDVLGQAFENKLTELEKKFELDTTISRQEYEQDLGRADREGNWRRKIQADALRSADFGKQLDFFGGVLETAAARTATILNASKGLFK